MNIELKALLALVFSGLKVGEDGVVKNWLGMVSDLMALLGQVPAAIANISDLQNEIKALSGSAQEQDLLSFIASEFAGSIASGQNAQAILNQSVKIVSDLLVVVQDVLAFKGMV